MNKEFIELYEELSKLSEELDPRDDYANFTQESPVCYKIFWPNTWGWADKTKYTNTDIPFSRAIEEIIDVISTLPDSKKYGITISCDFMTEDKTAYGNYWPVEAFYINTFLKQYKEPARLRFNSRSASPTPEFVRNAGEQIIKALGVKKFKVEDSRI